MYDVYDSASRTEKQRAADDLLEGLAFWRLWGAMGWQDVRNRYRRSVLGPFWLTLSMATLAGSLALVYGSIFNIPVHDYIGYLCIGLAIWSLFSSSLLDSCQGFLGSEYIIKQTRLPYSAYLFRIIWRNIIIFLHNIVVFFVMISFLGDWPGTVGLWAIPGVILLVLNMTWLSILIAVLCVRFRDIPPIVSNLTQLIFLTTPIMWKSEALGSRQYLVEYNPVLHIIEIVRAPLLGFPPSWYSWAVSLLLVVAGSGVTFAMFARVRARIAYWL